MKELAVVSDKSSTFVFLRRLPFALILSLVFAVVFTTLASLFAYFIDFPEWGYLIVGLLISCVMAFVCAFYTVMGIKKNGLMFGAVCAAVVFALMLLVSVALKSESTLADNLVRLLLMLLCGAIGGVFAANTRQKRR